MGSLLGMCIYALLPLVAIYPQGKVVSSSTLLSVEDVCDFRVINFDLMWLWRLLTSIIKRVSAHCRDPYFPNHPMSAVD